jgi:hypothetical protein
LHSWGCSIPIDFPENCSLHLDHYPGLMPRPGCQRCNIRGDQLQQNSLECVRCTETAIKLECLAQRFCPCAGILFAALSSSFSFNIELVDYVRALLGLPDSNRSSGSVYAALSHLLSFNAYIRFIPLHYQRRIVPTGSLECVRCTETTIKVECRAWGFCPCTRGVARFEQINWNCTRCTLTILQLQY